MVLPVRNGLKAGPGFLGQALDSIVQQDYVGPIELVVVDDGSTDGTANFVSQWAKSLVGLEDRRTLVLHTQKALGVTHALNAGLGLAKGTLIARQDADDYSATSRIRLQAEFLANRPDVGMVCTAIRIVRNRKPTPEIWYKSSGYVTKYAFARDNPVAHGSVMVRKSVIDSVGVYNVAYPHSQDYELFWRVAKKHKIVCFPEPLYFYRVHEQRVTSDPKRFPIQLQCSKQIKQAIQRELSQCSSRSC